MTSKREINDYAAKALSHLQYALNDLKRLRREPIWKSKQIYHDYIVQFATASEFASKIFKALYPHLNQPESEPTDDGADGRVRIRRVPSRLLESAVKQLPSAQSNQAKLESSRQLLLPGVES